MSLVEVASDVLEPRAATRRHVPLWPAQTAHDYMTALRACLAARPLSSALVLMLSGALSWWVYVPLHELTHVAGCVLTGGRVTQLELDPVYGARLLQRAFPFVSVGSAYAGRLSGFDVRGSDLTYLATDFAPYLWTIFFGSPCLRRAAVRPVRGLLDKALFGAALPVAFAPLFSLLGDYYEMGSVLTSRLGRVLNPALDLQRWRGDDFVKVVERVEESGLTVFDTAGVGAAWVVGIVLALLTFRAGEWVAARMLPHRRDLLQV